ncbi:MAG: hypothetical protein OEL76_12880 [Siculibacillus sp.]|nr:hypothetical protein [Siculibacillus sp.]
MARPDPLPSGATRHPILRALLRPPLLVAATIYFLIDDVVLAAVRPIEAWLAGLRLFARMAEALHRLPPHPTLVLFLVPFVVLEPFKLWGLWLIGTGHFGAGATMLAVSHLASIVLVERLFHATRDKLLTIGWFARVHGVVTDLYDRSLGRLRATAAWRTAAAAVRSMRETIARLVGPMREAVRTGVRRVRRLALSAHLWLRREAGG